MTVYILHLEQPFSHARHYVGFSTNSRTLRDLLEHHRRGTANCNFTRRVMEAGITFVLARVFEGADRHFERKLKRTKNTPTYCPICNPSAPKEYKPR